MICDMCGTETEGLFKTNIEGSELNVCENCSKFGKVISEVRIKEIKPKKVKEDKTYGPENEIVFVIVEDYAEKIRKRREELGLKQEDFAKKINEKQALIHKIETGHFEPSVELTRKIERFLKVRLIEKKEVVHEKASKEKEGYFTIGDIINIKNK